MKYYKSLALVKIDCALICINYEEKINQNIQNFEIINKNGKERASSCHLIKLSINVWTIKKTKCVYYYISGEGLLGHDIIEVVHGDSAVTI